ncbi:MAG: acyl-CoA dehydrogenase family protein [Planctomycetota bacterium]|jgi:acyl-CoA dehydrogenase family protein 9
MSESFAKGAFSGELSQDLIFPYPSMDSDQAEIVEMLRDSIRKYADEYIDDAKIDAAGTLPREVLSDLADMGIMGMIIPEQYGGSGAG